VHVAFTFNFGMWSKYDAISIQGGGGGDADDGGAPVVCRPLCPVRLVPSLSSVVVSCSLYLEGCASLELLLAHHWIIAFSSRAFFRGPSFVHIVSFVTPEGGLILLGHCIFTGHFLPSSWTSSSCDGVTARGCGVASWGGGVDWTVCVGLGGCGYLYAIPLMGLFFRRAGRGHFARIIAFAKKKNRFRCFLRRVTAILLEQNYFGPNVIYSPNRLWP